VPQEEIPQNNPPSPIPFTPDDSDAENWPEWLKSLGAAELENNPIVEAPTIEPEVEQPPDIQPMLEESDSEPTGQPPSPLWSDQLAEPPAQEASPSWMDQMAAPFSQQPPSPSWSDQLDELPAQQAPSWMNEIAMPFAQQSPAAMSEQLPEPPVQQDTSTLTGEETIPLLETEQQTVTTLENLEQTLHAQGFIELAPGSLSTIAQSTQEPTLSSALAQLGNITPPISPMPAMPVQETSSDSSAVAPPAQPSQSSWFATATSHSASDTASYISSQISPTSPVEPSTIPPYRADALLENELETTMKRPAVRLQPMQHPAAQHDMPSIIGQARTPDRPSSSGITENILNPRERLLRGYQHQLAGDYDEAMQEYRIIIRSTPELLGEVISNVRALLKLAPKYSAGYRVLGDAYMRQGEYLQAMEAYNKALSMTKKAKGA